MSNNFNIPISKNDFNSEDLEAIVQPLRDGWVVQGKKTIEFENLFSNITKSSYSLACSSGTAALHLACCSLGVKPGDEVIVPGFTWVATANVVELLGGKPVFCDIDLATFNINASDLQAAKTEKTVGIIPVHLFGLCADIHSIKKFAASNGFWMVEDAACALGSYVDGQHAGTFGDAGCFSFHPRKSITTGEGGMVTIQSQELARTIDGLRNHGALREVVNEQNSYKSLLPKFELAGFNYRLTDIQSALGVTQLKRLDWMLGERKRCAEYYSEHLKGIDWLTLPNFSSNYTHSWQSYVTLFSTECPTLGNVEVLHDRRNKFMKHLELQGIATRQGTHAPPHLDFYRNKFGYSPSDYPNSYIADRLTVALPVFPGMLESELDYIVKCISSYNPLN